MKRYLLFGWDIYYPSGGWGDYIGDFDTEDEAELYLAQFASHPNRYRAGQIVDTQNPPASSYDLIPVEKTSHISELGPADALDKFGRVLEYGDEVILYGNLFEIQSIVQDDGTAEGDDVLRYPRLKLVDENGYWTSCFADEVEKR